MSADRIHLAENLLREAVYQSRARQAAGVELTGGGTDRPIGSGGCGLGEQTAIDLELTEHGEELFGGLWPREVAPTELDRIQGIIRDWVERSDAFDRKRNHFLRDFRQAHGFDRRDYTDEQSTSFEEGLARINDEADQRLRQSAEELLAVE